MIKNIKTGEKLCFTNLNHNIQNQLYTVWSDDQMAPLLSGVNPKYIFTNNNNSNIVDKEQGLQQ